MKSQRVVRKGMSAQVGFFSYLRGSDGSRRALMLVCYETLDDFLSFYGRGSRSGAWQYDKFMATRKQPNLVRVVGPREAEMIEAERN